MVLLCLKTCFASSCNGTIWHLSGELFGMTVGAVMTHVLYKGSAHALIDLLSGLEPVMFAHTSTALHLIRNFKLVALTTMGIERSAIAGFM